jgi:hypothetical protein
MGSTLIALLAGMQLATIATTLRNTATGLKLSGSDGGEVVKECFRELVHAERGHNANDAKCSPAAGTTLSYSPSADRDSPATTALID